MFSAQGDHLRWLGDTKLNCPYDVTVDSNGMIYTFNHQVCVFDSDGKLLQSFGSEGTLSGQFKYPCGLTVDINGRIYISDYGNDCIQIF